MWFKPDLDDQLVSFSALTLLVWSSGLQKPSPKWPIVSSGTLNLTHSLGRVLTCGCMMHELHLRTRLSDVCWPCIALCSHSRAYLYWIRSDGVRQLIISSSAARAMGLHMDLLCEITTEVFMRQWWHQKKTTTGQSQQKASEHLVVKVSILNILTRECWKCRYYYYRRWLASHTHIKNHS